MELPPNIILALKNLVHELVVGNYAKLVVDGRAGRLTADELQWATQKYNLTLNELPDEVFDLAHVYRIGGKDKWLVDLPLWTAEEGLSDLTLQVTVQITPHGVLTEIDDLHVM